MECLDKPKMIGQLLRGRYRVIEALGSGGFSQTYIAEDIDRPGKPKPKCVVKHLKLAHDNPNFLLPTATRLFNSEAETLEKLDSHSQIPQLLAYFEEAGEFYLVQEYIEGHSLSAELSPDRPWTETQVIQLLKEALGILEFVHANDVIHRDIKPDNIIRRQSDGKLVLIDFGAVKQMPMALTAVPGQQAPAVTVGNPTLGRPTIAVGTSGYSPSEQGQGRPRFNSDIYALGMIGIQALTGKNPFELPEDPETGEILWQHLAPVSPRLANVLTKMVHYHFKDRYQTATDALTALQGSALSGHRNWKLIVGLGSAAIVGAIALVSLVWETSNLLVSTSNPLPALSQLTPIPLVNPQKIPNGYQKLQQALNQNDLEAADQITYKLVLAIAGPTSQNQGRLDMSEWEKFPCDDWQKIDRLWQEATHGTQGFSVQNKLFRGSKGNSKQEKELNYYRQIKWKDKTGKWLVDFDYSEKYKTVDYIKKPKFSDPPLGHLPAKLAWVDDKDYRTNKTDQCNTN